ncbi:hypothetical protein [Streptomyces sp. NPDC002611]
MKTRLSGPRDGHQHRQMTAQGVRDHGDVEWQVIVHDQLGTVPQRSGNQSWRSPPPP